MTPTSHPGTESLTSWVQATAPFEVALSVEQHLLRCALCRRAVADLRLEGLPDRRPAGLARRLPDPDRTWQRIEDAVVFPSHGRAHRVLVRLGLSDADATLLLGTPATRAAWSWSLLTVLVFVLAASVLGHEGRTAVFLLVAPVVPMTGVALAYGPSRGPQLEQLAATPYPGVRLVALRTLAVLAACLPVVLLASVLLPAQVARWWLLPAAAFSAAVLGLSSWVPPTRAVLGLGIAWIAAVSSATHLSEPTLVLEPGLLWLYTVLLLAGPLVFVARVRHLGTIGRIS